MSVFTPLTFARMGTAQGKTRQSYSENACPSFASSSQAAWLLTAINAPGYGAMDTNWPSVYATSQRKNPMTTKLEKAIKSAEELAAIRNRQVVVWHASRDGHNVPGYWLRFDDQASILRLTFDGLDGYDLAVVYIAEPKDR